MDFRQLRTFSCVAELGSLSKASDTLRVAQPALSRQIKLLEHELRADLFTRNGRGMVLTDAGRLLLARTAGIVRQIDQIRDDIQSSEGKRPDGGWWSDRELRASARFARRVPKPSRSLRSSRATAAISSNGCIAAKWTLRSSMGARRICTSPFRASAATTSWRSARAVADFRE
jgi:DNA-binding transcriptional LysR family regulator